MSVDKQTYKRWLKAAYQYYWGDGSEMSDYEWDRIAKQIVPNEHPELQGTRYEPGQSLFWLSRDKYPDWAKE